MDTGAPVCLGENSLDVLYLSTDDLVSLNIKKGKLTINQKPFS